MFDALKAQLLQSSRYYLEKWLPGGKIQSNEYVVKNPLRNDENLGSFKINVNSGKWSDFADDASGGDLVSLYRYLNGFDKMGEAAKQLEQEIGVNGQAPITSKPNYDEEWEPLAVAPTKPAESIFQSKINNQYIKAAAIYPYLSQDNKILGYTARFEYDGGKQVRPFSYCYNKEKDVYSWRQKGLKAPRPLFGLNHLAKGKKITLIVEGEKCAEIVNGLHAEKICAITWVGGSNSYNNIDWSPIHSKNVILWPDNDEPGFRAMMKISEILSSQDNQIKFVIPDNDEKGWDCYDLLMDGAVSLTQYIKSNMKPTGEFRDFYRQKYPDQYKKCWPEEASPTEPPPEASGELEEPKKSKEVENKFRKNFRMLGHDHGRYYFFPSGIQQIIVMKPSEFSPNNMMQLMDINKWEKYFPSKMGVDQKAVANYIIRNQERYGVYNSDNVRGRGAWFDRGRVVLHLGDHLSVDGKPVSLHEFDTRYIYEKAARLKVRLEDPLEKKEAYRFYDLCKKLNWERPVDGTMMAGWCAISVICGTLIWRPHIWITGQKGSGKSWIMRNMIKPILGRFALDVTSNTSEAGIRQSLVSDAFPILFDEAESKGQDGVRRMQNVIELLRQASSSDGASIVKGSQTGKAQYYKIRTCGCLSSIGVGIEQRSDESRISILSLRQVPSWQAKSVDQFREFERECIRLLTSEYCAAFRARAIYNIPIIIYNSTIFSNVAAKKFGSQREGDQIGTLLAGAYSLTSDNKITEELAKEYLDAQEWGEELKERLTSSDEYDCLESIIHSIVRTNLQGKSEEKSIAELIELYQNPPRDKFDTQDQIETFKEDVQDTLMRNGIKIEERSILISNTSAQIKNMLKDTSFSRNWGRVLLRTPGATRAGSVRFFGVVTRCTEIPLESFLD